MSKHVNNKPLATKWLLGVGFVMHGNWIASPTVDGMRIVRRLNHWSLESVTGSVSIPIPHPPGNRTALRKLCNHFGITLKLAPEPVE